MIQLGSMLAKRTWEETRVWFRFSNRHSCKRKQVDLSVFGTYVAVISTLLSYHVSAAAAGLLWRTHVHRKTQPPASPAHLAAMTGIQGVSSSEWLPISQSTPGNRVVSLGVMEPSLRMSHKLNQSVHAPETLGHDPWPQSTYHMTLPGLFCAQLTKRR